MVALSETTKKQLKTLPDSVRKKQEQRLKSYKESIKAEREARNKPSPTAVSIIAKDSKGNVISRGTTNLPDNEINRKLVSQSRSAQKSYSSRSSTPSPQPKVQQDVKQASAKKPSEKTSMSKISSKNDVRQRFVPPRPSPLPMSSAFNNPSQQRKIRTKGEFRASNMTKGDVIGSKISEGITRALTRGKFNNPEEWRNYRTNLSPVFGIRQTPAPGQSVKEWKEENAKYFKQTKSDIGKTDRMILADREIGKKAISGLQSLGQKSKSLALSGVSDISSGLSVRLQEGSDKKISGKAVDSINSKKEKYKSQPSQKSFYTHAKKKVVAPFKVLGGGLGVVASKIGTSFVEAPLQTAGSFYVGGKAFKGIKFIGSKAGSLIGLGSKGASRVGSFLQKGSIGGLLAKDTLSQPTLQDKVITGAGNVALVGTGSIFSSVAGKTNRRLGIAKENRRLRQSQGKLLDDSFAKRSKELSTELVGESLQGVKVGFAEVSTPGVRQRLAISVPKTQSVKIQSKDLPNLPKDFAFFGMIEESRYVSPLSSPKTGLTQPGLTINTKTPTFGLANTKDIAKYSQPIRSELLDYGLGASQRQIITGAATFEVRPIKLSKSKDLVPSGKKTTKSRTINAEPKQIGFNPKEIGIAKMPKEGTLILTEEGRLVAPKGIKVTQGEGKVSGFFDLPTTKTKSLTPKQSVQEFPFIVKELKPSKVKSTTPKKTSKRSSSLFSIYVEKEVPVQGQKQAQVQLQELVSISIPKQQTQTILKQKQQQVSKSKTQSKSAQRQKTQQKSETLQDIQGDIQSIFQRTMSSSKSKSKTKSKSKQSLFPMFKTSQTQGLIQVPKQKTKQKQKLDQKQKQSLVLSSSLGQRVKQESIFDVNKRSAFSPIFPKIKQKTKRVKIKSRKVPGKKSSSKNKKSSSSKRRKKRTPTLFSSEFNVVGKRSKQGEFSGIGLRPLTRSRK